MASSFIESPEKGATKAQNHAQDCGTLIDHSDQRPAILPWFSDSELRLFSRVI